MDDQRLLMNDDYKRTFRGLVVGCLQQMDRLPVFRPEALNYSRTSDYVAWLARIATDKIFEMAMRGGVVVVMPIDAQPIEAMGTLLGHAFDEIRRERGVTTSGIGMSPIRVPEREAMPGAPVEEWDQVRKGSQILNEVLKEIDGGRS